LIPLERILPDEGSSFRVLYQNVMPEDFLWDFHYHPEIELLLVFDGIGRRHVGNHVSYYENGDLVLIGSNLPHSGFGYGALGKHEEIVIQFKKELIKETVESQKIMLLLERAQFGISFSQETKRALLTDFREVVGLSPWEKYIWLLNILNKLADIEDYQLLNATQYQKSNFSKDQNRVSRIFDFVDKNYASEIDVKVVADLSNLTLPAFCNYFRKNLGVSFTDFLNEYRINQACILLSEGQSITDVAYKCGFNSLSYFSRIFKTYKKFSPTDFQRKVQKKEWN
jgi:AraC-like DNA-binding protein/mannose-6-phosphate isomerase-like protein (cupin superfamily)